MLRNSKFEGEEIEREKGVIIEEMNMYYDTPRDFIGGVYDELLYGDQPLGWDIIGRKETVRARRPRHVPRLRRPLVQAGADGRRPRRAARAATCSRRCSELLGDLESQDDRSAGGRRGRARLGPARDDPHARSPTRRTSASACAATRSIIPDRYALQLLSTVLGTGMSSRLFTEVRERRGLAYYVFAHNQSYTDAGSLYSQAGVDINRADEAVKTIAPRVPARSPTRPCPRTSSRRRERSPRDASCSGSRTRRG